MSMQLPFIPPPSAEDLAKTPPPVLAWFEARSALLEARIRELEARLNSNSSNSNQPPSSDSPFGKKSQGPAVKKTRKKRKGIRQQMLEPTHVEHCFPGPCSCGCRDVADLTQYYCHQYIETPQPHVDVTHFVLHKGHCTRCGKKLKALLPHEFRFGFGPRIHALVTELAGVHGTSREAVQSLLASVYNLHISQGAIQKCLDRASQALTFHYETIKSAAHSTEINHIDETTWRHFGPAGAALQWLWVMASRRVAYFKITAKRSKNAFAALIGDWRGVLVADGYGVYQKWDGTARQTCLAHLIRAARKIKEDARAEIAVCGHWAHAELVRLCRMATILPTFGEVYALHARLHRMVSTFRHRKDAAGTLARRLERELPHLMVFRKHKGAGPTNNHAERCLRFAVTWRKRSCGTTSEKGDRFVERILSLRHTSRLQARSTFTELVAAFSNYAKGTLPDTSWIIGRVG